MAPTSLAELRTLKRTELQALCKENNIKAGGKNELLISQLAVKLSLSDTTGATPSSSSANSTASKTATDKGKKAAAAPAENAPPPAAALESLSAQVKSLAAELKRQSAFLVELKDAGQVQPVDMVAVEELVDDKIEALERASRDETLDLLKKRDDRISLVVSNLQEQDELLMNLADNVNDFETAVPPSCAKCEQLEAALDTLRREAFSRLDVLEARSAQQPATSSAIVVGKAPSAPSPVISASSPALSDAPPTRSLVSFLTPTGSPATPAFAFDSPLTAQRQSVGARKGTPFKAAALAKQDEPVTAVPSHMLAAAAASAGRRTQRGTPFGTPTAAARDDEAASPAPVAAALGKHARSSILPGSERADLVERERHEQAARAETELGAPDGVNTAPTSVKKPSSELGVAASAREGDVRSSKRVRISSAMSTGTVVDNGEDEEEDSMDGDEDEDDEEPLDSIVRDEEQDEHDSHAQSEAEAEVRDYLVATKTGESPSTARKPVAAITASTPRSPAVSIHDPSFFASAASSPAPRTSLTPARRTSTFSFTFGVADENLPGSPALPAIAPTASTSRKSLPLAALPFPIVSPFRAAPSPAMSARKATPGTSKATMASFFGGDAAGRSGAGGAGLFGAAAALSASASAIKPRGRAGTLSFGGASSSSSSTATGRLSTPLAPRTLFGTEGGGEGRFGEAEGEAEDEGASPAKGGWRWERGAFGAVGAL
ncbi:hypothetical protein JCM9279_006809 [Rhodotorula babjevae]